LYEQKKKCTLDEVFDIQTKKPEVPQAWLDQVDNRPTSSVVVLPGPGFGKGRRQMGPSQQSGLWDQRAHADNNYGPFGYRELDPAFLQMAADQAKGRNGGKKNQTKKGIPQDGQESSDIFVPGPQDLHVAMANGEELTRSQMLACGFDVDDTPGEFDDLDDFEGYGELYGGEALEAFKLIDDFIVNLESCDKALLDVIQQAYGLLTSEGQAKLAQEGLR